MSESSIYACAAAEVKRGPDVCFVVPHVRDTRNPLYAVQLPQDIGRFVLIDDPDGFDVMFLFNDRWYAVDDSCWVQTKDIEKDAATAYYVNIVTFGRELLRRHGVREMTQKEWDTFKNEYKNN